MISLREFQAELERLHQQSETTRRRAKGEALARIRALMDEWELDVADLGFVNPTRPSKGAARYRDPVTGLTWTGKGRAPKWIEGKDRKAFELPPER